MYDEAEYMDHHTIDHDLMQRVFGDEWWYKLPKKPNPKYQYLCRIIAAAQEGVKAAIGSNMLKVAA